jgi:hypothetical protein
MTVETATVTEGTLTLDIIIIIIIIIIKKIIIITMELRIYRKLPYWALHTYFGKC